jgi:chromosome segregation ATPase
LKVAASKASQAETRLQQSQTDCESLREELQTAKAALAQLEKQRLAQSRASFSENDDRLKNLTTECESLREQVRRADQRHLETRQWLDETATECASLRAALDAAQSDRARMDTLERQLADAHQALDAAHVQLEQKSAGAPRSADLASRLRSSVERSDASSMNQVSNGRECM